MKLINHDNYGTIENRIGFIASLFIIPISILFLFGAQINDSISAKNIEIIVNNSTIAQSVNFGRYPSDILGKVKIAKQLLENSAPLNYETGFGGVIRKEISLALLNLETNEIIEKRIWVNQDDIENANPSLKEGIALEQDGQLPIIRNDLWNSFNSEYSAFPKKYIPLANKYLYPSNRVFDGDERSDNELTEIVYAPYSIYLHSARIINEGMSYLVDTMNEARSELINTPSVIDRNYSVNKFLPDELPYHLVLIEHIDPSEFLAESATDESRMILIERVLVRFGLNGDDSFRYTGSPANAWGAAQFTKPTYLAMVDRYPQAKLISTVSDTDSFRMGTIDNKNSFKAMLLLLDNLKEYFSGYTSRDAYSTSSVEEMLAAGYNGNPVRVKRSLDKFGGDWVEKQEDRKYIGLLVTETKDYIKKLRIVREFKLFK